MKIGRHITISPEVNEKLRDEPNASDLINELLKKHFAEDLNKQELEQEKLKVEASINEYNNKLHKINTELSRIQANPLSDTVIRYT